MRAVNLIPTDDRRGPSIPAGRSGGGAYAVLGLLGGLAVLALLYGLADHQISSRRSEAASLTARVQQTQARAGQLTPYTSFLQTREQRVQTVSELVDSRFDWAHAFQELGRVLPAKEVSLASLDGTVGSGSSAASSTRASAASGSSVASTTPPGSVPTFSLTGCAVSQAEVAVMLDRLRLIDGVSEVTLQSSTKSGSTSGGGAGSAGCEDGDPAFSVQIAFDPLPSIPAVSTAALTPASTSPTVTTPAATVPAATVPAPTARASRAAASAASTTGAGAIR
jgi:Tfp pilus assembly protein PilN